jgi:hypothetical protein
MVKSYRRKVGGKRRTRKAGGMMDSLKISMNKGASEANKHYEAAKKSATPHADKLVKGVTDNVAKAKIASAPHVETMKQGTRKMYNAQKYSNPSSFVAAKVVEGYGSSAMNTSKSMGKSMGNSMMNRSKSMMDGSKSMMSQYHPPNMKTINVNKAIDSGKMGVPQATDYRQ